jgi:hypothetical protein
MHILGNLARGGHSRNTVFVLLQSIRVIKNQVCQRENQIHPYKA